MNDDSESAKTEGNGVPTGEDLQLRLEMILLLWETGAKALARHGAGGSIYKVPSGSEIIAVLHATLDDIVEHRNLYNIRVKNYDINKLVNYIAWHLRATHDTAALFYGYLCFLDKTIRGSTLKCIPDVPAICENLKLFHQRDHKLTPYGVIKGIDLAYTNCCGTQRQAKWPVVPTVPERTVYPPRPGA